MIYFYRLYRRIISKAFSIGCSKSFAYFGKKSVITPPVRITGEKYIGIGENVFIGGNCWLQVLNSKPHYSTVLEIKDRVSIVGSVIISAAEKILIEEGVLIANNVYISDHMHQFENKNLAVKDQGISRIKPVIVEKGAWIGQNVVIGPGVTIGKGSVVGANSVVTHNVADYVTVAGVPAKMIRNF